MPNPHENILARWQTALDTSGCSPLEFYERVENLLTECELANLHFSQTIRNEGGWFSPRRRYLRIRYQRLYFDVSAFVAGNSLIVGWWLHEDPPGIGDLMAEIPLLGYLTKKTIRAATYYAVDYVEYFERIVHASILRVVDEVSTENGLPVLLDETRVPVLEEIW